MLYDLKIHKLHSRAERSCGKEKEYSAFKKDSFLSLEELKVKQLHPNGETALRLQYIKVLVQDMRGRAWL